MQGCSVAPEAVRVQKDVSSLLMSAVGSAAAAAECRAMLSDKLLSKTDYNCDREIRTLELLKLRFGDANLHNCEVKLCTGGALPHQGSFRSQVFKTWGLLRFLPVHPRLGTSPTGGQQGYFVLARALRSLAGMCPS